MGLEIHAPKADALARELASATGEDIDTAVVRAIAERLARTPRRRAADETAASDFCSQARSKFERGFGSLAISVIPAEPRTTPQHFDQSNFSP